MKHASVLLIALIGLCSLWGCGRQEVTQLPAPPLILTLPASPIPQKPNLPQVNENAPLDSLENNKILLERDDIMRRLISALYAALGVTEDEGHTP